MEEEDDSNYDSIYLPEAPKKKRTEEHDVVQQTENPYYGDGPDIGQGDGFIQKTDNPYYGGDVEIGMAEIKKSDNPYYGGDPDVAPPPHPVQVKDNPYYEGGLDPTGVQSDPSEENITKENMENVTVNENPYYA